MDQNANNSVPPNRLAGDGGFKDKTLLITGATGYMGKVLIEKILRTCPLVATIYVITRTKKGLDPQKRFEEIFTNPVSFAIFAIACGKILVIRAQLFDLLKKTRGEKILKKVFVIPGDVSEPNLGLSKEHRKLLSEEVQIIYHMAATVRFDEPLKKSILINTIGTKMMLELAKECKKLLVFAHVSTAYCHPHEKVLHNKKYPPPADPNQIIQLVEAMDESLVEEKRKMIMGGSPNTYTFSKALAEGLVNEEMDNLPIVIFRPSVVVPVWVDPLPGWSDNINGPVGLLIAAGKGVLRTMYCNSKGYADFTPVDLAANAFLIGTYYYMIKKGNRIYNLTTSSHIQATWQEIIELGKHIAVTKMPLNWGVWYPGGSLKSSRVYHNICVILFHYIPAVILDSLIILSGNKPVLWKVQQRLSKGFEVFEYYTNNQWKFDNNTMVEARDSLNATERKVYKLDEDGFDLEHYFYNCTHGVRLYILKESDESIPTARRHMKILWTIDRCCKILMLIGTGYLLLKYVVCPFLG